jgi:hypothetical protein
LAYPFPNCAMNTTIYWVSITKITDCPILLPFYLLIQGLIRIFDLPKPDRIRFGSCEYNDSFDRIISITDNVLTFSQHEKKS